MYKSWKRKILTGATLVSAIFQTDKRFVANYKNGAWDEGVLTSDPNGNNCMSVRVFCSMHRPVLRV